MLHAKLIVVGGDAKTQEVSLRLPATVGRSQEATLTVPHALVSRFHCEIDDRDGVLVVKDLDSLNGTYINNLKIKGEQPLLPGELLTLGNITFRADYTCAKCPTSPSAAKPAVKSAGKPSLAHSASAKGPARQAPSSAASAEEVAPAGVTPPEDHQERPQTTHPGKKDATDHRPGTRKPPGKPSVSGVSQPAAKTTSDSTIDFEELGISQPGKSVSLSALEGLPGQRPAVSFVGQFEGETSSPEDFDAEAIELDVDDEDRPKRGVDPRAFESFINKLK